MVAAAPVTDTIKQVARGREVDRTLDRSALWAAQTPQAFRSEALREAHASTALLAQATDDAMLVERIGGRVVLHPAPAENLKVTRRRPASWPSCCSAGAELRLAARRRG